MKIAQLYYLKYGEYEYYNKLKKYFELNLEPSEVHKKLFSLLPSLIVTTNWDCLLEHTAIEEGLTYDVIASDVDLVKSSYFHKIVKMHGDFQHHNIVFKEDDYLKYSDSFPLLENYLKSILSTHVVVFIGYSYSDLDLKLITKWIETKSKVTPPKYLFSSKYNEAEASYLKNHGIQFLNPKTKGEVETKDVILEFFNIISEKNELLRYKEVIEKDDISFDEKLSLVRFFYEKIKNLNELKSIFPKQIREIFLNSTVEYQIECYALYLISDTIVTYDYDELVRNYYKVINEIIIENKDKKNEIKNLITSIFYIFKKANIVFLKFSSREEEEKIININEYLGVGDDEGDRLYLNFKSKGLANDLIFLQDYQGLSKQSIVNIYLNIKERSYIDLAINSFNNEVAQRLIKTDFRNKLDDLNSSVKDNKNDVKIFKDYFDFYGLTNKKEYNFINSFLNFNVIDGIYRSTNERIKTNIEKMKTIKNGGFSIDMSFTEEELTIQSLLDFIYKNNIAMEGYREVSSIFKNHIDYKIKLIEINYSDCDEKNENNFLNFHDFSDFPNKPDFSLNIMDLFIIINFSDNNKLIEILRLIRNLFEREKIKDVKELINENLNLRNYLTECFENIKLRENILNDEKIMRNLVLVSSLCDWGDGEYILNKYKEILSVYRAFGFFDSVNRFVAFNSFFVKSKKIDFIPYVDFLISSVMNSNFSNLVVRAIEQEYFSNTFNYMSWRKDYNNVNLIENFIHFLNFPNNKDFYSIKIIPYLLYISNDDVKNILRKYVLKYIEGDLNESKFELFLLVIIYDEDFLKLVSKESYDLYLGMFEKYCDNDFVFKKYLLKKIIISLSKSKKGKYKIFKDLKLKYKI